MLSLTAAMGAPLSSVGEGGKLPCQPTIFSIGKFALSAEALAGGEHRPDTAYFFIGVATTSPFIVQPVSENKGKVEDALGQLAPI